MALVTTLSRSNLRVSTRRDKYYIGERYRESTFAALFKTNQQYTFDNEHISCEKNKQHEKHERIFVDSAKIYWLSLGNLGPDQNILKIGVRNVQLFW